MTTDADAPSGAATLTASGIARLANVGRAAVSNWRRRYADFPAPVGGTPNSPSFDAREVEQWLRRHGRLHHADARHLAWQHIESYQPAAQLTDALTIAGCHLLVRAQKPTGDATPTPKQLLARLRGIDAGIADLVRGALPDRWTPQLTGLLSAVDRLAAEHDPETAFEYLHGRYVTSANPLSGLAGTPDTVAEVMLTLAGSGPDILDFTSGTGSILRMAADQALRRGTDTRCHAQEIKPQYALITLIRLWFVHLRARRNGQPAQPPAVHVGDSLLADAVPGLRADVVVANFPFGIHDWGYDQLAYDPRWAYGLPPRTEPELAWVQHALAHLSPGGTAVVLMPPAAALRPAGRRIRAELVRRGALRAIIALPAGLMPPTGLGLHVWALAQPDPRQPPADRLLVVDTTAATGRQLPDIVGEAWRAHLAGNHVERPGVHRAVPAIEMLDDQVDLTPQRYLPQAGEPSTSPDEIIGRIDELAARLDNVRRGLPALRPTETTALRAVPRADIADLIRSGTIAVHRTTARRQSTPGIGVRPVLTTTDVITGGPPTGTADRAGDDAPEPRVLPGDILMPLTGRRIHARVATPAQVGAEPGPGVQLVRVDPARFDPWFVAGVVSRTGNLRLAGRSTNGTLRIDIRRLSIPVLPLSQQQTYGRIFAGLVEFRSTLDEVASTGAALARDIADALTDGTLEPSTAD
ncbi:class I SAM-dependent DNA methyltransferase [Plantactinospora sp. KBS50]|uniref:HsdM family class I SAM-dependent methyltransferase n=1 Tax=Plantactinospora sp. KBS50 TaxID=2024580 RepID=UPI000BAAC113|nr:N-6 DNA methylase [Plantactinospora sp. KBS50]ASW55536.1 SAM-dependent methyltransferase [Plantactinospora sp. KBS50]